MKLGLSAAARTSGLVVLLALGLSLAPSAQAQTGACDLTSVAGSFGYTLNGFAYDSQSYLYMIGAAGRMQSDSNGNLTGTETYSFDGNVLKRAYTGTYVVNADCTGSMTLTTAGGTISNFDFFLVSSGKEIDMVQTDANWVITAVLKQVGTPAVAETPAAR